MKHASTLKMAWAEHVGGRMLVKRAWGGSLAEVTVVEVSPTGGHIKLRYEHGAELWAPIGDYRVVEFLKKEKVIGDSDSHKSESSTDISQTPGTITE